MFLYSDPSDDIRHVKDSPGAYEWWYFDAVDPISGHGIVAILYDGLLFSPDYHDAVKAGSNARAEHHPGFSLSLYDGTSTVFYALTSYPANMARFGGVEDPVAIGNNVVTRRETDLVLEYTLHVDETLPSGLRAEGEITFASPNPTGKAHTGDSTSHHRWNLVQPSADVRGSIRVSHNGRLLNEYSFGTKGYHDHNVGMRPLKEDFEDWYWGRIHIGDDTLVWYSMNHDGHLVPQAWLMRNGNVDFSESLDMEPAGTTIRTIFGLERISKWRVNIDGREYLISDDHVWDNGPFYQRYQVRLSDITGKHVAHSKPGIAEYIKPARITASWVKPMIRIRHHRVGGNGNWIQRSVALSRLTW